MSFWNNIFGQLTAGQEMPPLLDEYGNPMSQGTGFPGFAAPNVEPHTEPVLPPMVLDERVNPPTPPEREGLEGSIIGSMRDDPLALSGYRRNVIDWGRNISPRNRGTVAMPSGVAAEYVTPGAHPIDVAGGRPDTIRFREPEVYGRFVPDAQGGFTMRDVPEPTVATYPDFTDIGRHEFRHRGMYQLPAAARAVGASLPASPTSFLNLSGGMGNVHERLNVAEDRRTGYTGSYGQFGATGFDDLNLSPSERQFYELLLQGLRNTADRVNADRVRRLHAAPSGVTWSDLQ